jgi:hypothetical protein
MFTPSQGMILVGDDKRGDPLGRNSPSRSQIIPVLVIGNPKIKDDEEKENEEKKSSQNGTKLGDHHWRDAEGAKEASHCPPEILN